MAAIKSDKKTALAAFTTAALSLPGLTVSAAIPSAQILSNVSYGHYQESDNRMQVDIYHADAIIPLTDRLELAFSLDRDTYSGATPSFSMPASMTNVAKYKQKADGTVSNELSYVDVISAASGGVTAAGLTILGGLNGFQSFSDGNTAAQAEITTNSNTQLTALETTKTNDQAALDTSYNADKALITDTYKSDLNNLNVAIPALTDQYETDKAVIETNLAAVPGNIANNVTIDFNTGMSLSSYAGFANTSPIAGGGCPGSGSSGCYNQNGMVVGIVEDTSNPIAHLHRAGTVADRSLQYHSDSSGIYIRSQDSKAFSLDSMNFKAPISGANPDNGPNDYWEILGFNTALNPNLDTGDGTNYATRVAYQTVANGFDGTLQLNSSFNNINAAWIHFKGYPQTPTDGKEFSMALDNINVSPVLALSNQVNAYNAEITTLTATYNTQLAALTDPVQLALLTNNYTMQMSVLTGNYTTQTAAINQSYTDQSAQNAASLNELAKQAAISLYSDILNSQVPTGTQAVQVFQVQPQETRSMPQVNVKYYLDATTLAISGGLSDEPDYLSNFGSTNISHEFNDKLTTVSAGYGMTSNTIARNGSGHSSHHGSDPAHYPTSYQALNEASTFNSFTTSIAQVLSKNTLFQSTASYTNQSGYLSNPYKSVYVRGEITPTEYYNLWNPTDAGVDWNAVTNLEVVGLELFRENRPRQRNIGSLSNRINHYIPELDASAHFDYRFYTDDWGINSHTFEAKWFQTLPGGFTIIPSIRYYSQSQADFFAPYFLAPRADGNYSSDFRLSAFGDLSGGATLKKQFARGISLEIGAEYVTHSGSLKLGGGGVGNYANFDYYLAHANLSVDLSAKALTGGDHSSHTMHHHGVPVPAGVMYGHMMSQADEIMVGYRYQYSNQGGAMLHGSDSVNDQALVSNACTDYNQGCLYKPTSMNMQMHMLDLMYAPTDWLNIMLMPQLMSMDMTMSNPIRPYINQTEENDFGGHGGAKHFSNDIGDTVVTALVKVLDKNGHHVHLGLGMSTPTGSIGARLDSSNLQDYGMQTGSGTWDFKPSLTYTGQVNDFSWGVQVSGVKRLEKNKYDYAYGDIFQATPWGSYQAFNWLSASVRGVYTAQGDIKGATNQAHQVTSTVDSASNYGGRFLDVGVGLNASVTGGKFVGHNVSFEWLQPVSTDYNGYQLNRNGALAVSWNYAF
ncbi:DUF3570 domain-containing protein [Methylobacter sp. S3L5C]|uniref:DUF3570 domain-containing protein n=1 Tax=Methylobacter sp. S3L5C TaxID=2839024 RepID=UPI001FAD2E00|nr:DUF3570 domain-containing protein [Methylobacter sp. S3L5C]UOA07442.1 DUF3570 domain-containing protein [Methylobacter sp. S3L5C]